MPTANAPISFEALSDAIVAWWASMSYAKAMLHYVIASMERAQAKASG